MAYQTNSRQDTLIKTRGEFVDESEQTIIGSLRTFGANIEFAARNNHRPYLMLYGEVAAVAFPNGKFQPLYPPAQIHVRYEYSDDEISELAAKGLYYDGFKVPEIISDNPNIEIPMTVTARRYVLMNNVYTTLDLAANGIYTTDNKQCGYRFSDYFEPQIPSQLETEPIEEKEDAIPIFDDNFAEQFAAELKNAELDDSFDKESEEFAKEIAQAKARQESVTAELHKVIEKSPVAQREKAKAERKKAEREKAKAIGKQIASDKKQSAQIDYEADEQKLSEILDDDAEFAAFRQRQAQQAQQKRLDKQNEAASNNTTVDKTMEDKAEKEGISIDEAEAADIRKRVAASDASVNVSVSDTNGDDKLEEAKKAAEETESEPDFGDVFGEELYDVFETKEDVENALQTVTSTKHTPQKLTAPDTNKSDEPDFSIV